MKHLILILCAINVVACATNTGDKAADTRGEVTNAVVIGLARLFSSKPPRQFTLDEIVQGAAQKAIDEDRASFDEKNIVDE